MPYTLIKFLLWAVVFFAAGMLVGWLLRSLTCRSQVAAARRPTSDEATADQRSSDEQPGSTTRSPHGPLDPGDPGEPASSEDVGSDVELARAAAVLGSTIRRDDLTVVDGIGPKIAELCAALGITTWDALAETEVATLRSMLDDAGSRFKMHDPTSWPEQARLLAGGRWEEFSELLDHRPDE